MENWASYAHSLKKGSWGWGNMTAYEARALESELGHRAFEALADEQHFGPDFSLDLTLFGFFSWGHNAWIHESDLGWVMDTTHATELVYQGSTGEQDD